MWACALSASYAARSALTGMPVLSNKPGRVNRADKIPDGRPPASNRHKTQEPLESSTIFESVVIVAQLTFSLPLHLRRCLGWGHADLPSSVAQPFSAAHFFWALLQANSCVRQLRGFCFPGSALTPLISWMSQFALARSVRQRWRRLCGVKRGGLHRSPTRAIAYVIEYTVVMMGYDA
jgi:hypothetical protein